MSVLLGSILRLPNLASQTARPWNIGLFLHPAPPRRPHNLILLLQERLKAAEAKRIEKERTEKYNKLKTDAKDARAKYREKVRVERK